MPRHRSALLGIAALAALLASSCHSTRAVNTSTSATATTAAPASTSSSPSTPPPSGPFCPAGSDVISGPLPSVQIQAPGSLSPVKVTKLAQALPCSSVIRVDDKGAANFTFGTFAACQFQQDLPPKEATAVAREPDGTLIRVQEGVVYCTTKGNRRLTLCGSGDIQLNGDVNQVKATCDPDPVFEIEINMGVADVLDPSGAPFTLGEGQGLGYDFAKKASTPAGTNFSPRDLAIFQRQAARLGVSVPTTTTSTSSTSTTTSTSTTIPIP